MRVHPLLPAIGLLTSILFAVPSTAAPFDIKGTWAAEGKACQEAALFVEFDGRDILNGLPVTDPGALPRPGEALPPRPSVQPGAAPRG
jgi:hypothetical protein